MFAAILVASIFAHEFGHAWGCMVQGVPVRRVVLHGGGGFCEHAHSPRRRQQELIVVMGPLVNLAIWAICGIITWYGWTYLPDRLDYGSPASIIVYEALYYISVCGWLNGALFIFNLIPVQPLDGGKLLHLMVLRFLSVPLAQRVTGTVGLVLSVVWIPAAIFAYVTFGWILFFFPSPVLHWRMMRGNLAF